MAAWLMLLAAISIAPWNVKHHFVRAHGPRHFAGHFAVFLITAFLLAAGSGTLHSRLLRCCGAIAVAFVVEAIEAVYFRFPLEWQDVCIDSAGAIAGLMLLISWHMLCLLRPCKDSNDY